MSDQAPNNTPTPARIVTVVQAIFKSRRADEDHYLMQFDEGAGRFQPIGGKFDPDDPSLAHALRREIAEELSLDEIPGPDVLQINAIGGALNTTQISATYGILTQYTFHFFHMVSTNINLTPDDQTIWISRSEMAAGLAHDNRSISSILIDGPGWPLLDSLPPLA